MGTLDEFEDLADTAVETFDNSTGNGAGGRDLYLRWNTQSTYDPATQVRGGLVTVWDTPIPYIRSASRRFTMTGSGGAQVRVEEFDITIKRTDLDTVSAGLVPDERYSIQFDGADADNSRERWPIVRVVREAGERLVKMTVRKSV